MKHRSVIAFILLAAALFAAPQIANDLSAMRSAFGVRLRGEILRAVLNLKAEDGANELVVRRDDPLLASLQTSGKACTQPEAKKREARAQTATRAGAAEQSNSAAQLAMLIDPMGGNEIASAALSKAERHAALSHAATLPQGEIAMITAPDAGVELQPLADALSNVAGDKNATRRLRKSSEEEVRFTFVATAFEKLGEVEMSEEIARRISATLDEAKVTGSADSELRAKVIKIRRTNRNMNSKTWSAPLPLKVTPPPVPVAALIPPGVGLDGAANGE